MGKFSKMLLNGGGGGLAGSMQMDRRFMVMKIKLSSGGCLSLSRSYIHVYDHNIQTSSLKPLGQSKPNIKWSIFRKGE